MDVYEILVLRQLGLLPRMPEQNFGGQPRRQMPSFEGERRQRQDRGRDRPESRRGKDWVSLLLPEERRLIGSGKPEPKGYPRPEGFRGEYSRLSQQAQACWIVRARTEPGQSGEAAQSGSEGSTDPEDTARKLREMKKEAVGK